MNTSNFHNIRVLLSRREQKLFISFVPLFIISVILEGVSIGLVVPLVSTLTDTTSLREYLSVVVDTSSYSESLMQMAAIFSFAIIFFVKSGYSLFLFYYVESIYVGIRNRLHKQMYGSYLRANLLFHKEHNTSVLRRNVDEIGTIFQQYLSPMVILLSEASVVLGLVVILLVVDFMLSLAAFIFISFLVFIVYKIIRPKIQKLGGVRLVAAERTDRHMLQGFFAVTEIKSKSKEDYFSKKYSNEMFVFLKANMQNAFYNLVSSVFVEVLFVVALLSMLVVMISFGRDGEDLLPILALFALTSIRIMSSVKKIMASLNQVAFAVPSVDLVSSEINYLKNKKIWIEHDYTEANKVDKVSFVRNINLQSLFFKYPSAKDSALKEINLSIVKGQIIGVVGHSGSGKTTIINILLGLLKPTTGSYCIDDNCSFDVSDINHLIGYVPQSIYILDDTIINNVAFGCGSDEIDYSRVVEALKLAHVYSDVESLPNGLDTVLGENGASLSGGQIQRIGIARALYDDPEIIIFDEATSSLDNMTESIINSEIENLSNFKTIVIVAHRLSSVKRCDNIYYMEKGRIIAEGDFSELYVNSQSFRTLVEAGTLA